MNENIWYVYLSDELSLYGIIYWHIPGFAAFGASDYSVLNAYVLENSGFCDTPDAQPLIEIERQSGPGEAI